MRRNYKKIDCWGEEMINIAICDDEPLALEAVSDKIKVYMGEMELPYVLSKFSSGEELLSGISKTNAVFDVVFLDIKMGDINGIDTARAIRKNNDSTAIVFVTALKEYAIDAFDVNASNYLLKPIEDKKLFSTLDKVLVHGALQLNYLTIGSADKIEMVPFKSIVYCEVLNHRIFVYEKDNMREYAGKIEKLEQELDNRFFRCHRSYIVNLTFVESYKDGIAYLVSSEKLPVATRRKQAFMQALLLCKRKEVR